MSSRLAPLLETQRLDLAVDEARKRALELPERAELPVLQERIAGVEQALSTARAERKALEVEEEELGRAVSEVAAAIEAAEIERYSGSGSRKTKDRDAAEQHEASQAALRERQSALEEREMELLEAAEVLTERIAAHESELASGRAEQARLEGAIRDVESEVEASVARLSEARGELVAGLPESVVAAYERVRAQGRSGGRGAAVLSERRCGACRINLPSLEYRRMLDEPEDALIQCPQCRRVLVRDA